jgi:signal peptidase I
MLYVVKETLTSILIAFAMAFVFRGFVVEAFLIPTGSMAPTLRGAHMQFTSPSTGYNWAVGPWDVEQDNITPVPLQGATFPDGTPHSRPISVNDPMSGRLIEAVNVPARWGDRIFVLKYLYSIFDPARFDVVVFRNPRDPNVNYIKRLLGLPGEQLALVDGDVFVRRPRADDPPGVNQWSLPGWEIRRKPDGVQHALWQDVFDSGYEPRDVEGVSFLSPWVPEGSWERVGAGEYHASGERASLRWEWAQRRIDDSYAYNQTPRGSAVGQFPVSDVRVSVQAKGETGAGVRMTLAARGHEYRAAFEEGRTRLEVRRAGTDEEWLVVARAGVGLSGGRGARLEMWHVDQALSARIDGREVCRYEYEWTIEERLAHTMRATLEEAERDERLLMRGETYRRPEVWVEVEGAPVTLRRVALWRDIHYQATYYRPRNEHDGLHARGGRPALATHPLSPLTLGAEQFFVCGDNSPESLDSRLWDIPHPWIARIEPRPGVVHKDLLIGKAFFVYFPAPQRSGRVPVPDFGRMRAIR